jgi:hypothetical protein
VIRLQYGGDISNLPNQRHYGYLISVNRHINQEMFTDRINSQARIPGQLVSACYCGLVRRDVFRTVVKLFEVRLRCLVTPAGFRPLPRLAKI